MTFREHNMLERTSHVVKGSGLRILVAALFLLLVLAIAGTAAPSIETTFGGASVEIAADRSWVLLPGDCVTITWDLEGIHSLYVDGQGKIGWGEMAFCPSTDATNPVFDITAENGQSRAYELNIRYFPAAVAQSLLLLLLISPFLIAAYYLATLRMTDPIPLNANSAMTLLALLLFLVLVQTVRAYSIEGLLWDLGNVFTTRAWQSFGLVLAGLVFIPLVFEYCSQGIKKRLRADFLVIGVFVVFILLLYLPFGFDSIGQYEEWVKRAFLEGRPSRISREVLGRFFLLYADSLAETLDSSSFVGFHQLNFLIFCGKLTLFYVILGDYIAKCQNAGYSRLVVTLPGVSDWMPNSALAMFSGLSSMCSTSFGGRPAGRLGLSNFGGVSSLFINLSLYECLTRYFPTTPIPIPTR